ncbi:MAG TPA: response regulator, partial [Terriglobales bacterium]|nr:response regulator [Terriglobales bacterium]
VFSAVGANGVAALLGAAVFAIGAHSPFWFSWWMWWLSNGIGILVMTPCIVSWSHLLRRGSWDFSRWRALEAFLLMAGLAVAADAVFGFVSAYSMVLPYVAFPFLIWAALRFGVQGGATATVLLASIAVWDTAHGLGPFTIAGGTVGEKLIQVQSFILAAMACSLVPAIVMTERETAENKLRRSEARLALAQEIAGLGTFEFDFVQNRVSWSDEAFRIVGRDPALGPPTPDEHLASMHPDDREMMQGELAGVLGGRVSDVDYRCICDNGSVKYVHVIAQPVKDQHGQVVRALGTVMDISDRKRIEEELRQAQKMEAVGRLAGGVAHDFNNLLGVIIGYAELALSDLTPDNPSRSKIEPISKAASRAASLTAQLLAFSRKQVLKPEVLSLNTVVSDLGKMLRRVIGEEIELVTELQPSLPLVKADPNQLDQVLLNLAVNAKDAMPNGGRLAIRTSTLNVPQEENSHPVQLPAGTYVMLTVSDTGKGMDELTRAHIFEPFFTTKEKGKGTGLGLATVYGIVSQSSGHVWVDSAPGAGATFYICLPAVEKRTIDTLEIAGPSSPVTRSETVLLVEDEQPLRELIREVLTSMGCRVLESTSGEHALRLVSEHQHEIDIVLTDVIMPKMNGFELSRKIAELCPGIKVLYMSGYSDEMIARHDRIAGQTCFIQKPFKPEELRDKLHEIVGCEADGKPL